MTRGITVWEECEHGRRVEHCADHPDLAGLAHLEFWGFPPVGRGCTGCPGGRSVSLTREEAIEKGSLAIHKPWDEAECEDIAELLFDALLAVVDKEPQ